MLREAECMFHSLVPTKDLGNNRSVPKSLIITCLLKQLSNVKAVDELGYFLSITELKNIGKGKLDDSSRYLIFPVTFVCRTFLPVRGEVLNGVVRKVNRKGVFLKCGPMYYVYLSLQTMPNYYYVHGDNNPVFLRDDMSRIEKDIVVRFRVFSTRWMVINNARELTVVTVEGHGLGPILLAGFDEMEMEL